MADLSHVDCLPRLVLTPKEFGGLLEYSASLPTGTTIGKRWKRLDGAHDPAFIRSGGKPRWMVGEYKREVVTSDRHVVGDLPPNGGKGPLINLRCRIKCEVEIAWYRPVIRYTAAMHAGVRGGIYVASKNRHAALWQHHRAIGIPIISTWIDEAGPGESTDLADLWHRCIAEAKSAAALVLYRTGDDVLRGAWAELGAALAEGVPAFAVGIGDFTISHAAGITLCETLAEAISLAMRANDRVRRERNPRDRTRAAPSETRGQETRA